MFCPLSNIICGIWSCEITVDATLRQSLSEQTSLGRLILCQNRLHFVRTFCCGKMSRRIFQECHLTNFMFSDFLQHDSHSDHSDSTTDHSPHGSQKRSSVVISAAGRRAERSVPGGLRRKTGRSEMKPTFWMAINSYDCMEMMSLHFTNIIMFGVEELLRC